MSFAPPVQMKNGGVDGRNLATTQEGIPLPWFCGIRRLKAHWITQATNRRTRDGGRRKGEHWFCQITAAFGYGPAAGLLAMYYNGKYEDYGFKGNIAINEEDFPGYYTMAPNDFGLNGDKQQWEGAIGRIHWGETQTIDPINPSANYPLLFGNDTLNPRYWRVILAEWNQLFLGINNPSRMPNIEATFARHAQIPAGWSMQTDCQYWLGGEIEGKNWTHGVPPVPALLEILTDTHTGFARDPDEFDQSTWEGIASELTADKWRINPLLDQFTTEDAVIETFLKYFDGYTYTRNGKLALGRRPDTVTILNPADYTEFTAHDMTRPPGLRTTRPDETVNEVGVTYTDATDSQYKEVSKVYDAPTNREARGEPVREDLDLSWKLIEYDVDAYVRKWLGHAAAVRQLGSIWVRENRCVDPLGNPLQVGDVIFLDQSVPQLDHAYRITDRVLTDFGEIQLKLETERGQYPLAYVAPSDPVPNAELPAVDGIGVVKWLELPYELTGVTNRLTIFPILKRASGTVAGCTVWFKDSEDAFHPVADYGPPNFGSSGDRVAADSIDEETVREWTVAGAGTAACNGLYTKGADINGRPAWYGPGGHKIAYVNAQSPWAILSSSDDTLYINDSETFASDWAADAGAGPDPTVDPDLWLLRATLDDAEEIVRTVTKGESEDNTLLMCQGNEIYSVELVIYDDIASNYKIYARRGRLGSLRETHGAGGTLAFIRRASIAYLGHEFIQYGATITYKLQPRNWAQAAKLEDMTEQQFTVSAESQWLPTVSFNSPTILNSVIQGDLQIGEDVSLDFDVTAPRGRNEDVSIAGYRFGASQSADSVQDAVRQWIRPTQSNFKAVVELPILEWYAITVFATNRYGTAAETIWAYAGPVVHAQGLTATGSAYGIDLTWQNDDLPDYMWVGVFDNADGSLAVPWIRLEGDAITNLSYFIKLSRAGNYAVWIQSYRVVNGKEYTPENWWADTSVPVNIYGSIDEPLLEFLAPYSFQLTWDQTDCIAIVGEDGYVVYEWQFDGQTQKERRKVAVGEGIDGVRTIDQGDITINAWLEDKDGNKGIITQHTGHVLALPEAKINEIQVIDPYTIRLFYDPTTVHDYVHAWGWPNYSGGFKERVWADYVTPQAAPNNYIDFPCIRDAEYQINLYSTKEKDNGLVQWTDDPTTTFDPGPPLVKGGQGYATPIVYPAPAQLGGAAILTVPNPHEFILYWDGSQWPATKGQMYLVYRWKPASGGNQDWKYNYQLANYNQMNQKVDFNGGIHVEWWIEDQESRKGTVTQDTSKTILGWAAMTNFSVDAQGASWDAQTDAEIIEVWADNGDGSWNESYRCDGLQTGAALNLIDFGGLASTETQYFRVRYMKKGLWSEFSTTDSYTYP